MASVATVVDDISGSVQDSPRCLQRAHRATQKASENVAQMKTLAKAREKRSSSEGESGVITKKRRSDLAPSSHMPKGKKPKATPKYLQHQYDPKKFCLALQAYRMDFVARCERLENQVTAEGRIDHTEVKRLLQIFSRKAQQAVAISGKFKEEPSSAEKTAFVEVYRGFKSGFESAVSNFKIHRDHRQFVGKLQTLRKTFMEKWSAMAHDLKKALKVAVSVANQRESIQEASVESVRGIMHEVSETEFVDEDEDEIIGEVPGDEAIDETSEIVVGDDDDKDEDETIGEVSEAEEPVANASEMRRHRVAKKIGKHRLLLTWSYEVEGHDPIPKVDWDAAQLLVGMSRDGPGHGNNDTMDVSETLVEGHGIPEADWNAAQLLVGMSRNGPGHGNNDTMKVSETLVEAESDDDDDDVDDNLKYWSRLHILAWAGDIQRLRKNSSVRIPEVEQSKGRG